MPTGDRSAKPDRAALKLAALVAIPIVLGSIPLKVLERTPTVCLARRAGFPCWGCGMTRAIASALRGNIRGAWRYNRLSVVVVPLLAYVWAQECMTLLSSVRAPRD